MKRFDSRGSAPAPGRRRIPAEVWNAAQQARRLNEEATAAADRILADATAQAAEIERRARAAGREEGLATATETIAAASHLRDRLLAAAEPELVELAMTIARSVVGSAAERERSVVVETAARALGAAGHRTHVRLRAHPADVEALRTAEPCFSASLAGGKGILLVADGAIARGGVVVETDAGTVDATLDAQLAAVRRVLDHLAGAAGAGGS
jgi:flagellar biosynthesis/type III secretory pathway protein FliH